MASAPLGPVVRGQQIVSHFSGAVPQRAPVEDGVSVRELLDRDAIVIYFQPILSARQRTTLGVEALARAPLPGGYVVGAPELFARAADERLVAELERRCCEKAITRFARLPHRRDDQEDRKH